MHNMTIPNNTTYKLIGLAATGAAMLGMNLEDALCTDPAELARTIDAYLTRHTTTTPAVAAAEEEPAGLPAVKKLPLPQPPSLTGPGDILDADTIDWTNPNLYK